MISLREGTKVECIKPFQLYCGLMQAMNGLPMLGMIYTISGFQNCHDGEPGLHLKEFPSAICGCVGGKRPFPLIHFRPLTDEKKTTSIEVFEKILRDTKVPEKV